MSDKIPPGYKKTEIGIIPEDWKVKRLGEVVKKITTGKLDANAMVPNGKYKFFTCAREVYRINHYAFDTEALLIAGNGAYVGYIHYYKGKFNAYQRTYVLYDFDVDVFFLKFLLEQKLKYRIKKEVNAGNTPYIKLDTLTEMELSLPPTLTEQRAIARILSDFDALIESLDTLIEKKKAIKKGAMQELLTGKKRLPGFKGEWVRKRLGEILKYEQPTKYIVQSTEYLENGFIPVLTPGKTFILGYTDEKEGMYRDVPVIIFDDFTTASKYVTFPFKVKSSAMKILKQKDSNYDLRFIFEKMQMIDYSISEGDHKRRWIKEYQYFEIELPPALAEQRAIAQILSNMDAEIEALERKRKKYEMMKKGAMELLLTGKIRVEEVDGKIEVLK